MDRYYDGCIGWMQTVNRQQAVKFSSPYNKNFVNSFIVRQGNPGNFNPDDVTGKTIGNLIRLIPGILIH